MGVRCADGLIAAIGPQVVPEPDDAVLDAEDVYWGTRLACAEMIRNGIARFWDMYWQPEATAQAVEDAGMRATIGGPLFDAEGGMAEMRARVTAELDALAGRGPSIVSACSESAPCSPTASGSTARSWS